MSGKRPAGIQVNASKVNMISSAVNMDPSVQEPKEHVEHAVDASEEITMEDDDGYEWYSDQQSDNSFDEERMIVIRPRHESSEEFERDYASYNPFSNRTQPKRPIIKF